MVVDNVPGDDRPLYGRIHPLRGAETYGMQLRVEGEFSPGPTIQPVGINIQFTARDHTGPLKKDAGPPPAVDAPIIDPNANHGPSDFPLA